MADVLSSTYNMSSDFYTKTGKIDDQYAVQSLSNNINNYLYFTLDVATHFNFKYSKYLRDVEPSGVYTKETYASLMDRAYIQYGFSVVLPNDVPYRLQVLNLTSGVWEDFYKGTVGIRYIKNTVTMSNPVDYISDEGIMFTRLRVLPEPGVVVTTYSGIDSPDREYTVTLDGDTADEASADMILSGGYQASGVNYDLRLDFFELGFSKDVAVRPTIVMFDGTVTSSRIVTNNA